MTRTKRSVLFYAWRLSGVSLCCEDSAQARTEEAKVTAAFREFSGRHEDEICVCGFRTINQKSSKLERWSEISRAEALEESDSAQTSASFTVILTEPRTDSRLLLCLPARTNEAVSNRTAKAGEGVTMVTGMQPVCFSPKLALVSECKR